MKVEKFKGLNVEIDWDHFASSEITREQYSEVLEQDIEDQIPGVESVVVKPNDDNPKEPWQR